MGMPFEESMTLIPSIASPTTLNKRPLILSPVGILIALPVEVTSIPLVKPSVESIEIARMEFSPTWACTSSTTRVPSFLRTSSASYMVGRAESLSNATSTTGPIT